VRLILIGPQGAGKGTQGDRIARWFRVPHIETGKLLRAAVRDESPLGTKAIEYMDRGELVPDDLVVAMLEDRIAEPDASSGFVMDGFPRNISQAKSLDEMLESNGARIDAAVSLEVPDEVLVARLADRWTCPQCGRVYNTTDHHPIEPGRCNQEGALLVQRPDDQPEAIRRRLEIFHSETTPVIGFYEERDLVLHIDGVGTILDVQSRIIAALAGRGFRRG